ncbi:MAG TPA: c-type cytochrome [Terriglobia bacterium]|nr:c-type cytochrome [Terriglobia bacterium]
MKLFTRLAVPLVLGGAILSALPVSYAAGKKSEGASTFMEKCSMCHGLDGKGYEAIHTPNFTDPKWQAAHSDKELMSAIENGVKGTAMVSFQGKLSHEQMVDVLNYIRSLGGKAKK